MPIVARWTVHAKFGHKPELIAALKEWHKSIGTRAGLGAQNTKMLTGSIGAKESEIQLDITFNTISELDAFFNAIPGPEHTAWGKKTSDLIVSGQNHWEVFRVVEL